MPLLERVSTLLRANLNDLIARAEDPEKMLRQLLLDMENQLLQVKTQIAVTLADLHMLEKQASDHEKEEHSWQQKARLAVSKGSDDLARAALDRSLSHAQLAGSLREQITDQRAESDIMRSNYSKLQLKLAETEARCDLLIAQNRRARTQAKLGIVTSHTDPDRTLDRLRHSLAATQATNLTQQALLEANLADSLEDRFRRLEREDAIEALLNDLKQLPSKAS